MKKIKQLFLLLCCVPMCTIAQIYVSPTGADGNAGTLASPTTLQKAITIVQPGQTIFMRGGTYNYNATIIIAETNNGNSGALKNVFAYNGELPIIDFGAQALSPSNRGIVLDGDYWYFKGITIQNAGDNGVLLSGNNNIFENCVFRRNRDSGLQMSRFNTANTTISQWPSNNLVLNCEAFDNKDATSENADGFAAKLTCGNGNIFRGCIGHNNADDGWDFYAKDETGPIGIVTLENCVAYGNGTLTDGTSGTNGDRNGFKLGGSGIAVNHIVRRCVAYNNGKHGFTDNNNPGAIELSNNTSYNNAECNFNFRTGSQSVQRNNLSFLSGESDKFSGTNVGNSNVYWVNNVSNNGKGLVVSSADFVSVAAPSVVKNADGSPNLGNFLALANGSDMINSGVTAPSITFTGSAPDVGARESGSTGGVVTPQQFTLTTNANPTAGGTVSRSPNASTYAAGTVVTLTATAASGYTFTGWSGASTSTNATITVTVNANTTVTANFAVSNATTFTLTTNAAPSVGGTISRSPNAANYANGTVVTLTATAASGYTFSGFTGSVTSSSASTTVTMNANKTVTANFTVNSGGGGTAGTLRIEDAASFGAGFCAFDGSRQSSYTGASGGFYINFSNSAGRGITYSVNAPTAGTYGVRFRYANAGSSSATTAALIVNGATAIGNFSFPKTSSWTAWTNTASANITLRAGVNTIRIETTAAAEFANIDYIEITGNNPTAAACAANFTANKNAAESDDNLVNNFDARLLQNPAKNTIYVQVQSPKATLANWVLVDQQNKIVAKNNQAIPQGTSVLAVNSKQLAKAMYVLKINVDGKQKSMKVLLQ